MGFLNSLFKSGYSNNPEDYHKIYFRWEIGGQEYGPLFFDDMITRNWSGPPIEGRFENERNWRKYDYFLEILNNLKASQNQLIKLSKYNVSVDKANLKFRDAIKIIEDKEEELRKQRALERREKEKLPATKNTINKLKSYGIKYPEYITRVEAKELILKHEENESIKQIIEDFNNRGINISEKFNFEISRNESINNMSFSDLLDEMNDLFFRLSEVNVKYDLPAVLNAKIISEINNKFEDALSEAEDAEEQIKDREFSTLDYDYKITGNLPDNTFKGFNKEIIERYLEGSWDFERDILKLLKKHFPNIKLKREQY